MSRCSACSYLQCLTPQQVTGAVSVAGKLIVGRWPKVLWLAEMPLRTRMLTKSSLGLFWDVSERAALPGFLLLRAVQLCCLPAAVMQVVSRFPWRCFQAEIRTVVLVLFCLLCLALREDFGVYCTSE